MRLPIEILCVTGVTEETLSTNESEYEALRKKFVLGDQLSSKERLLLAIGGSEPDHVPLYIKWWIRQYLSDRNDMWKDQFERIKRTLNLGLDDTVGFEPPRALDPDIKVKNQRVVPDGERYPLLLKEYRTPKGDLKQVVCQTQDWPHGVDVPIFTDFVVPRGRSRKYLIENVDDVEALSSLFSEPNEDQVRKFQDRANQARDFARQNEVLLECGSLFGEETQNLATVGYGLLGGDALAWLCGIENAIVLAHRNPDLIHRLLDIILEWDMRYIRLVSEGGGSDIIVHRGWYDHFWSPKLYEIFLAPRLRKEIEFAHKIGAKFCHVMTSGIMPFLEVFKELGVDILFGVDPQQGGADLKKIKQRVGDCMCLWGGVNSAVTVGRGNKETIETAVTDAVATLAPGGGFILSAIDALGDEIPWTNVESMIQAWRKVRSYPISIL